MFFLPTLYKIYRETGTQVQLKPDILNRIFRNNIILDIEYCAQSFICLAAATLYY